MDKSLTPEQILNFRARQDAADKASADFAQKGQVTQEAANAYVDAFLKLLDDPGPTDVAVL